MSHRVKVKFHCCQVFHTLWMADTCPARVFQLLPEGATDKIWPWSCVCCPTAGLLGAQHTTQNLHSSCVLQPLNVGDTIHHPMWDVCVCDMCGSSTTEPGPSLGWTLGGVWGPRKRMRWCFLIKGGDITRPWKARQLWNSVVSAVSVGCGLWISTSMGLQACP